MPPINWGRVVAAIALPIAILAAVALTFVPALIILATKAPAREAFPGQWAQADPARQDFFKNAMRPDLVPKGGKPTSPCCGVADAYEADDFDTSNGILYAILTCNDPENCAPDTYCAEGKTLSCREPRPAGTRIPIRPEAILPPHQPENKTGHGWVFLASSGAFVFCYAPATGL